MAQAWRLVSSPYNIMFGGGAPQDGRVQSETDKYARRLFFFLNQAFINKSAYINYIKIVLG